MPADTILTFDLGTTACKICLWDAKGALLASADEGYPTRHPQPEWAEQDPADWWRAAVSAGRQVVASQGTTRIAVIGLSSLREAVVSIGADGSPLSRCIIWMDRRCRKQSARLGEEFGAAILAATAVGILDDPASAARA